MGRGLREISSGSDVRIIMTILYFIIALSLLVLVHEFGHFIMAKRAGIRVDEFSIGFGPRLFGFKRGETDYRLCLIPLGGYVKVLGQDPDDEGADDPRSFSQKGIIPRFKILIAGPLMNVLLSLLLMPAVFFIGRDIPRYFTETPVLLGVQQEVVSQQALKQGDQILAVNGKKVTTWEEVFLILVAQKNATLTLQRGSEIFEHQLERSSEEDFFGIEPSLFYGGPVMVEEILPDSPAKEAGLQQKDKIQALNGNSLHGSADFTSKVHRSQGGEVKLTIERNGEILEKTLAPRFNPEVQRWLIGIQVSQTENPPMVLQRYDVKTSLQKGFAENIRLLTLVTSMLKKLVTLEASYKNLGGPIAIAKTSAMAAKSGLSEFLYFLAFLSLQLGILNLLPIPVLDGGHLAFLGLEAVRGKPLPKRTRFVLQQIGFAFLLALMIAATVNDLKKLFG